MREIIACFCVPLHQKVCYDGTTLEQELLQGDGSEFYTVFRFLYTRTFVASLFE